MADQKTYNAPGLDVNQLAQSMAEYFASQEFEAQVLPGPSGAVAVQIRKADTLRRVMGATSALMVTLTPVNDMLTVQTAATKWGDKAIGAVAGVLLFWPALIPAAYGAFEQTQLPQKIWGYIEQYLGGAAPAAAPVARPAASSKPAGSAGTVPCPSCKKPVKAGAKFCEHCGSSLVLTCKCGATLNPGAKFCENCGAQVK
jgi:hypothetical protein